MCVRCGETPGTEKLVLTFRRECRIPLIANTRKVNTLLPCWCSCQSSYRFITTYVGIAQTISRCVLWQRCSQQFCGGKNNNNIFTYIWKTIADNCSRFCCVFLYCVWGAFLTCKQKWLKQTKVSKCIVLGNTVCFLSYTVIASLNTFSCAVERDKKEMSERTKSNLMPHLQWDLWQACYPRHWLPTGISSSS